MNKQNRIEIQYCELPGFASEYIHLVITRIHFRRGTRRPELLWGFTLIELLVVISIIFLLASISIPALQRARNQAKAVVCQSNLRQWGLVFPMYLEDNDGRFFPFYESDWCERMQPYYRGSKDLLFCPMATRLNREHPVGHPWAADDFVACWYGGTFSAWGVVGNPDIPFWPQQSNDGSYGLNAWICDIPKYIPWSGESTEPSGSWHWETFADKGTANVPVLMDSSWPEMLPGSEDPPPKYDDCPDAEEESWAMHDFCINRHDGGVNGLFMDWSVRKVGLKELWTLKWHREFNTAGPWTRAGGVRPQDWPKWMRKFRDY